MGAISRPYLLNINVLGWMVSGLWIGVAAIVSLLQTDSLPLFLAIGWVLVGWSVPIAFFGLAVAWNSPAFAQRRDRNMLRSIFRPVSRLVNGAFLLLLGAAVGYFSQAATNLVVAKHPEDPAAAVLAVKAQLDYTVGFALLIFELALLLSGFVVAIGMMRTPIHSRIRACIQVCDFAPARVRRRMCRWVNELTAPWSVMLAFIILGDWVPNLVGPLIPHLT